jgi:hypothetical protein
MVISIYEKISLENEKRTRIKLAGSQGTEMLAEVKPGVGLQW